MSVLLRLAVAGICAVGLIVGGFALERAGPAPSQAGSAQEPISGAWSCPHGGGEGWRVWVSVTNPGSTPVEVRMTTAAGGAATPASSQVIEPSTLRYFEVGAPIPGSATVVEYLGGTVAAGSVVVPKEGGLAAEPCVSSPGSVWHVAEASSLRGETSNLVIHNPFAAQAVVDVVLTTGERQIRHSRVQGVVLGPLDAKAFELNNLALGEAALGATVLAVQGRVAVASVVVSPGGIRSSLGVAAPGTRSILLGLGAETDVVVRALPDRDAPVSAEFHTADGPVPALDLEAVSAGTAEAFGFQAVEGGMVVRSDGPSPMIAGRRMVLEAPPSPAPQEEEEEGDRRGGRGQGRSGGGDARGDDTGKGRGDRAGGDQGGGGNRKQEGREEKAKEPAEPPTADEAATSGVAAPAARWLVPPASGPEGPPSVLLLQNPGETELTASVTLLGTAGALGPATSVQVPARATVRIEIQNGPAAALVEGRGVVAAQATLAPDAFAVAVGVPI
jgi:Family of unknown function (DUF5719)